MNTIEKFKNQVLKHNEKPAVIQNNVILSYKELDLEVEEIVKDLKKAGVNTQDIVAVELPASPKLIATILAILQIEAIYLPIDNEYPSERKKIISDLCNYQYLINKEGKIENKLRNRKLISKEKIAYIIFTSGSTGEPKGVMISHHSLNNLLDNSLPLFEIETKDVWIMCHSPCFDFSIWEIFSPLTTGNTLVIPSEKSIECIAETIIKKGVNILNQTPHAFYTLKKFIEGKENKLKYVIFGGDKLSMEALASFKSLHPLVKLVNMYGITETTVHTTFLEITENHIQTNSHSVGRPLPHLNVWVVNSLGNFCKTNEVGELYIGGNSIADGYINNPTATNNAFFEFPSIGRIYKSGDIGKINTNGELEHLGRNDAQVKIRGFRVELGEIENTLYKFKGIKQCYLLPIPDSTGNTTIVAYIVLDSTLENINTITKSDIKNHCAKYVPSYMIPSNFIFLKELPLNKSGKVSKKYLPDPMREVNNNPSDNKSNFNKEDNNQNLNIGEDSTQKEDLEEKIASCWEKVLGKEITNKESNFFDDLGGHSLSAAESILLLESKIGEKVPLSMLAENPTISSLAIALIKKESDIIICLNKTNKAETKNHEDIDKKNSPLILIHGGEGGIYFYRWLVKILNTDRDIYAIEAPWISHPETTITTIEKIVEHYSLLIKRKIPNIDQCVLGGYSAGGLIALELSKKLDSLGIKPERVLLFDCNNPEKTKMNRVGFLQWIKKTLKMSDKKKMTNFIKENLERMKKIEKITIKDFHSPVTLFQCKENKLKDYGWGGVIKNIEIIECDSNHFNMFEESRLPQLANFVEKSLRKKRI